MQLSTSVAPPDSPVAAPALPGCPASNPAAGTSRNPVVFASLLARPAKPVSLPGKKPTTATAPVGSDAASAVWSAWLATLAPVAAPAGEMGVEPKPSGVEAPSSGETSGPGGTNLLPDQVFNPGGATAFRPSSGQSPVVDAKALPAAPPATGIPLPVPLAPAGARENVDPALLADPTIANVVAKKPAAVPGGSAVALPAAATAGAAELLAANADGRAAGSASAPTHRETDRMLDAVKFADPAAKSAPRPVEAVGGEDKKILSVNEKHVTDHEDSLGTADAITAPVPTTTHASLSGSTAPVSAPASAQLQPVPFAAQPVSGADISLLAHRAVDAVMTATERLGDANRSTIRLQFSVGDANLSVQVELRAGQVHTTFRTDSSDLRTALASEWQAMSGDSGRAVRLADPVFASASTTPDAAGFGQGATGQRHSGEKASAENFQSAGLPAAPARSAQAESALPERRTAAARPDLNLYTFA